MSPHVYITFHNICTIHFCMYNTTCIYSYNIYNTPPQQPNFEAVSTLIGYVIQSTVRIYKYSYSKVRSELQKKQSISTLIHKESHSTAYCVEEWNMLFTLAHRQFFHLLFWLQQRPQASKDEKKLTFSSAYLMIHVNTIAVMLLFTLLASHIFYSIRLQHGLLQSKINHKALCTVLRQCTVQYTF